MDAAAAYQRLQVQEANETEKGDAALKMTVNRSCGRSASEAITQQAAAGMNLERPTAQDKAKQRPAENTKAAGAKQKVIPV